MSPLCKDGAGEVEGQILINELFAGPVGAQRIQLVVSMYVQPGSVVFRRLS